MEEKPKFEIKAGKGSIFKNDYKNSDNQPDYKGKIKTPSGEELEVALWVKKTDKGSFFSVKVQNLYNAAAPQEKPAPQTATVPEPEDDLPF